MVISNEKLLSMAIEFQISENIFVIKTKDDKWLIRKIESFVYLLNPQTKKWESTTNPSFNIDDYKMDNLIKAIILADKNKE